MHGLPTKTTTPYYVVPVNCVPIAGSSLTHMTLSCWLASWKRMSTRRGKTMDSTEFDYIHNINPPAIESVTLTDFITGLAEHLSEDDIRPLHPRYGFELELMMDMRHLDICPHHEDGEYLDALWWWKNMEQGFMEGTLN